MQDVGASNNSQTINDKAQASRIAGGARIINMVFANAPVAVAT